MEQFLSEAGQVLAELESPAASTFRRYVASMRPALRGDGAEWLEPSLIRSEWVQVAALNERGIEFRGHNLHEMDFLAAIEHALTKSALTDGDQRLAFVGELRTD